MSVLVPYPEAAAVLHSHTAGAVVFAVVEPSESNTQFTNRESQNSADCNPLSLLFWKCTSRK